MTSDKFWSLLETGDCPNSGICMCAIKGSKRPEKRCIDLAKSIANKNKRKK